MGLMSNLLQRTVGRQKLRQWAENSHLEGYPTVRIERRYEDDDEYVDLYWFIHLSPDDNSMVSPCFTRCFWNEIDNVILRMEQGEVVVTIEELLHEQLADGPQELLHEEISKTPEEEFPLETVFSENDTINETINAGLTTSKISPKKHSKPKSSGHTHRLSKPCRRRRYLANLISVSPYVTMPEMAKKTGVSRPTIARDLAEMKQAGIIRRVGAVKNGYWELLPPEK